MQTVGGVDQPSGNMLAHGGQDQAEGGTVAARGAWLAHGGEALFAFEGAFGA